MHNKKILIVGQLLSVSGYSYHVRTIADAIPHAQILCIDHPANSFDLSQYDKYCTRIVSMKDTKDKEYDVVIYVHFSNDIASIKKVVKAKKYILATALVETTLVEKETLKEIDQFDGVCLISEFTKNVLENSIKYHAQNNDTNHTTSSVCPPSFSSDSIVRKPLMDRTTVIYHTIPEWFRRNTKPFRTLDELPYDKNILVFGEIRDEDENKDRKRIVKTIKHCLEYVKDKEIGVVLKSSFAGTHDFQFKQLLIENIKKFIEPELLNKLTILYGSLSDDELRGVFEHRKISCFASLTAAEGFGMGMFCSALASLPVVATNYSAYLEFVPKHLFFPVDYELRKANINVPGFDKEGEWAEANISSFYQQLDNALSAKRRSSIKMDSSLNRFLSSTKKWSLFISNVCGE